MNNEKTKKRQHRFLDRRPWIGALLLMCWGLLASESLFAPLFGLLFSRFLSIPFTFGFIPGALLVLMIHRLWFRPEFKGCLFHGNSRTSLRLFPIMAVILLLTLAEIVLLVPDLVPVTAESAALACAAGFCEETAFRALPLSFLMRRRNPAGAIPRFLLFTSACFGLVHGLNVLVGAPLPITILQVFAAACIGVFLGGFYLRTGSIFLPILFHTLYDLIAFLSPTVQSGVMTQVSLGPTDFIDLGLTFCLAVLGFRLIRPAKRPEILSLWDGIWSRTDPPHDPTDDSTEDAG